MIKMNLKNVSAYERRLLDLLKTKVTDNDLLAEIYNLLSSWDPNNISVTKKSIQVIDMFSGCGGMSLGFDVIGKATGAYRIISAVDIDEASLSTYSNNFHVPVLKQDITRLATDHFALNAFLGNIQEFNPKHPLVLIGCAPCQGFTAHRKKQWDEDDARNGLVEAFGSIVAKVKPDFVVMENVPELLSGRYWSHFNSFRNHLTSEGYTVKQGIYNAATFGVAQERFRAIVFAMRTPDFSLPYPLIDPEQFRTVRDAIGDLPFVVAGEKNTADHMHRSARHRRATIDVIRAVPKNGGSRPKGIGPQCLDRIKGFSDVYGRLSWNKPSITITHYARNPASGRFIHPEQDRGLTMREAARLQGFPDSFNFKGTFDDIFRQIGEAVPPPLATAVAITVLANIRGIPQKDVPNIIIKPVKDSYASVIAGIKMRRK